jgi:hypothetical protein
MTSHQVCNVRRDKTLNLRQHFAPHFSRSSGPPLLSIRMAIASRTFVEMKANQTERKYILDQRVSLGHNSDDSKQEVAYGGDITETLLKRGVSERDRTLGKSRKPRGQKEESYGSCGSRSSSKGGGRCR